jgi:molybdopterin adenylyltransferase
MKVLVLTVSDRASAGIYEDKSGPAVEKILQESIPSIELNRSIVPDNKESIIKVFEENCDCDVILTTGGTGLSARDVTPDVTIEYCEKLIPGIAEAMRAASLLETPNAMLSRAVAGIKGRTVIINMPGSEKGAVCCTNVVKRVLEHIPRMISGDGH